MSLDSNGMPTTLVNNSSSISSNSMFSASTNVNYLYYNELNYVYTTNSCDITFSDSATINFVVVGGGGGGACAEYAGGGGGGAIVQGYIDVPSNTTLSITVGSQGNGGYKYSDNKPGISGSASGIYTNDLTIQSGGGAGGSITVDVGANGGSVTTVDNNNSYNLVKTFESNYDDSKGGNRLTTVELQYGDNGVSAKNNGDVTFGDFSGKFGGGGGGGTYVYHKWGYPGKGIRGAGGGKFQVSTRNKASEGYYGGGGGGSPSSGVRGGDGTQGIVILCFAITNYSRLEYISNTIKLVHSNISTNFYDKYHSGDTIIVNSGYGDGSLDDMTGTYHIASNTDISTLCLSGNFCVTTFVTDMSYIFHNNSFNEAIDKWDTANVTNMSYMFKSNSSFNQDISAWNTSKVINMAEMFYATNFNQDISDWNTINVTRTRNMFMNASAFNQDIGNWVVSKFGNTNGMFKNATSFNQDIGDWDVANVINMGSMFMNAIVFNQDISGWDVRNVTNMNYMFANASNFYQNVRTFNASSLKSANYFIKGATLMLNDSTQGKDSGFINNYGTVLNISNYFDGVTVISSQGDPHIYPFYGESYELPKQENIYRLLQGDNLLLNASTKELSLSEQNEIYEYINVICKNKQLSDDKKEELTDQVIVDGCFYNKIYLNSDNHKLVFDFKKSTLKLFNKESVNYFTIKENKKYNKLGNNNYDYSDEIKQIIISFNNKKYGIVNLELNYFSNPQLKYGISLNMKNYKHKELSGLLMREYKINTMTINELQYEDECDGKLGKNKIYSKNVLI
jgi:surface protein